MCRGARRRRRVVDRGARHLAPLAEELDRGDRARDDGAVRPLVLLDSWERLAVLDAHLRQPPAATTARRRARVVIASRRRTGAQLVQRAAGTTWCSTCPWGRCASGEADALLAAAGRDGSRAAGGRPSQWAGGAALALALAADAGGGPSEAPGEAPAAVVDALLAPGCSTPEPEGEGRSGARRRRAGAGDERRPCLRRCCLTVDAERAGSPGCAPHAERRAARRRRDAARARRAGGARRPAAAARRSWSGTCAGAWSTRSTHAERARGAAAASRSTSSTSCEDPAIRWGFAWDTVGATAASTRRGLGDAEAIAARGGPARRACGSPTARRWFEEAADSA